MSNIELIRKIERLKLITTRYVTDDYKPNEKQDLEKEYYQLRDEVINNPLIKDILPDYLSTCVILDECRITIKPLISGYQNRRIYLIEQFKPVLNFLRDFDKKGSYTGVVGPKQPYSGAKELKQILVSLDGYVEIIDPYVDRDTLDVLVDIPAGIPISVLTESKSGSFDPLFIKACTQFKVEKGIFEIRIGSLLHDRYIIDKNHAWSVGHSLKDFGKKVSSITSLTNVQKIEIERRFDSMWNMAKLVKI